MTILIIKPFSPTVFQLELLCYRESFQRIKTKMIKKIKSKKNITEAYFDLVKKFDEEGKSYNYTGFDGINLSNFDITSSELLNTIRKELRNLTPIQPVVEYKIPKKDGDTRTIYAYTIKDRIKAQAIYRILEPFFEKTYSSYLFSYRSSKPSYYAAKTVTKRYKKHFGKDTIFKGDISDYTENIDKKILIKKLKETGLSKEIIKLLKLFTETPVIKENEIIVPKKGVIQGVPIITFFANLYLNDLDKFIGGKVALYRRVGDDFILFDKDKEKILKLKEYILKEAKKLKLIISPKKTLLIKSNQEFEFLGYHFENQKITIKKNSIKRFLIKWKKKLKYRPYSSTIKKKKILKKIIFEGPESINHQFIQFIAAYKQANNKNQIKKIEENFLRLLTKYFFGKYSKRNQRLTKKILKKEKIPSIYKYFLAFHNGEKTISELSVSTKK